MSAERISEVLASESTLTRAENPVAAFPEVGSVEFRDAEFAYPGAESPVLHGITFRAEPGETVAIVGSTGAGKTTLVSLIPRLFDATSGSIRVNGVDVREADLDHLWKTIGLVPQRPFLFAGTVASNLRFGREEATDAELWHALEIAQGRDFVAEMEGGLNGRIAQGGTNVSGGQRQRLAIARAIVHNPDILVFDDSFSALDLTTDARLRQALWRELPGVTKIVVAQRVSTITDADRIIVLDDGGMVGIGTHDELLETIDDVPRDRRIPARSGGNGMSADTNKANGRDRSRARQAEPQEMTEDERIEHELAEAGAPQLRFLGQRRAREGAGLRRQLPPHARAPQPVECRSRSPPLLGAIGVVLTVIAPKVLAEATNLIFEGFISLQFPRGRHAGAGRGRAARRRPGGPRDHGRAAWHAPPSAQGIDFVALPGGRRRAAAIYIGASLLTGCRAT